MIFVLLCLGDVDLPRAGYGRSCKEQQFETVTDISECKRAAARIGKPLTKHTDKDWPKGCYMIRDGGDESVSFNDHHAGRKNSNADPICLDRK